MYRGIIYVKSTEMEESSARSYTKDVDLRSNQTQRNVFPFYSLYQICERGVKSADTHNTHTHKWFVWGC